MGPLFLIAGLGFLGYALFSKNSGGSVSTAQSQAAAATSAYGGGNMTSQTMQQAQALPNSALQGWDSYPTATDQDAVNAYNMGLSPQEYVNGGLLGSQG